MTSVDPARGGPPDPLESLAELDSDSVEWLRSLRGTGAGREAAVAALHALLLRVAHAEVRRRAVQGRITGPELADLAFQATADALLAITAKLDQFRGESRFTTWAYKFVIFAVSGKIARHFWQRPTVPLEREDWDRLPDVFGPRPEREAEWRATLAALRHAVENDLTPWQREVFVGVVLTGIPLDTLAIELDSNRNALYKTLFDARRKLRSVLDANGYLRDDGREEVGES